MQTIPIIIIMALKTTWSAPGRPEENEERTVITMNCDNSNTKIGQTWVAGGSLDESSARRGSRPGSANTSCCLVRSWRRSRLQAAVPQRSENRKSIFDGGDEDYHIITGSGLISLRYNQQDKELSHINSIAWESCDDSCGIGLCSLTDL